MKQQNFGFFMLLFSMAPFHACSNRNIFAAGLLLGFFVYGLALTGAQYIGVCHGRKGNNLPSAEVTKDLYKRYGIGKARIYDDNLTNWRTFQQTKIELIFTIPNEYLQDLTDPIHAGNFILNILAYVPDLNLRYISVGNEVKHTDSLAKTVLPVMQNIHSTLVSAGFNIKVSTSIGFSLLGTSHPPSAGVFNSSALSYINPIVKFLAKNGLPLLANVYPYFHYANLGDVVDDTLSYALFSSPKIVYRDGKLEYQNLFDAQLDALYTALEKAGAPNLEIVVSETGWPSAGATAATVENAATYYKNVISHVQKGTPKRPGKPIETYLFNIYDENQKGPEEVERHFGLFSPNGKLKYNLKF